MTINRALVFFAFMTVAVVSIYCSYFPSGFSKLHGGLFEEFSLSDHPGGKIECYDSNRSLNLIPAEINLTRAQFESRNNYYTETFPNIPAHYLKSRCARSIFNVKLRDEEPDFLEYEAKLNARQIFRDNPERASKDCVQLRAFVYELPKLPFALSTLNGVQKVICLSIIHTDGYAFNSKLNSTVGTALYKAEHRLRQLHERPVSSPQSIDVQSSSSSIQVFSAIAFVLFHFLGLCVLL